MVMFFSLLIQGSYFPAQYLTLLLLLSIILLFKLISLNKQMNIDIDNNIFVLFMLFTLIYITSTIFVSDNKYLSMLETSKIAVFTMFFISVSLMKDKKMFLKGTVWSLFGISILGLLSYMEIIDIADSILIYKDTLRLQSVIQYANVTAALMGIGFFISYYFIDHYRKLQTAMKYYILSYLFLLSLILTLSRGAILTFIICLVIWLFLLKDPRVFLLVLTDLLLASVNAYFINMLVTNDKNIFAVLVFLISMMVVGAVYHFTKDKVKNFNFKKIFLFIIIFAGFTTVILINSQLDRIFKISPYQGTFVSRLVYFKDGLKVVKENFLLGIGPGNWTSKQFFYQNANYYVKYIHNGPIQITLDTGIFGLLIFILILVFYYYKSLKGIRQSNGKGYILFMIIILYILLHSFIDIDLSFSSILLIFSGILAFDPNPKLIRKRDIKSIKNSLIISLGLVIGLSTFLLIGQMYYTNGEYYFIQGKYDEAIKYYEKSRLFKPYDNEPYIRLSICYEMTSKDRKKSTELLKKANILDSNDPRPLIELIKIGEKYQDYQSVYDTSIELININKFNILGYESGLKALLNMLEIKAISPEVFNERGNFILNIMNRTNEERDAASEYMEHNEALVISEEMAEKLKGLSQNIIP